jgi:hypothetical protein
MAVSKKSLENLKKGKATQFSSTNQPENSGRRPSVFAKYIRENRVSLDDIRALISSMLGYDAEEIKAILKDKLNKPPIGIILLFNAIMADLDKKEITNYEKLVDRAFGKPDKTIKVGISEISAEAMSKLDMIFSEKEEPKVKTNGQKPRAKRKNN